MQNAAQSTSHRLSRCQVVLTKRMFKFGQKWSCQNLSFWVFSQFNFEFCHNLSFWFSSQFEFSIPFFKLLIFVIIQVMSFVRTWVFGLCHNLSFLVLSQFEFLSFLKIWFFELCHNLSFVTIWVFEFCFNLSFWVFSQFGFSHNLGFQMLHIQFL